MKIKFIWYRPATKGSFTTTNMDRKAYAEGRADPYGNAGTRKGAKRAAFLRGQATERAARMNWDTLRNRPLVYERDKKAA